MVMTIKFFCPRWGSESIPWDVFCKLVRNAGYDGIETAVPFDERCKKELTAALLESELLLIGQYFQSDEADFDAHRVSYEKHLRNIASVSPLLIDSQTGKDYFTPQQSKLLFQLARRIESELGITIAHETHRNKALFSAHVSYQLLSDNPLVRITADFSHWCCVAESLLEDQSDALAEACERAIHIHARVGYAEGPQVTDPFAKDWAIELQAHLNWWDVIVKNRIAARQAMLTITPEFGPPPYMHTLPHTGRVVADQWEINLMMMGFLRQRYQNF